jgi:hypothetical protein
VRYCTVMIMVMTINEQQNYSMIIARKRLLIIVGIYMVKRPKCLGSRYNIILLIILNKKIRSLIYTVFIFLLLAEMPATIP